MQTITEIFSLKIYFYNFLKTFKSNNYLNYNVIKYFRQKIRYSLSFSLFIRYLLYLLL